MQQAELNSFLPLGEVERELYGTASATSSVLTGSQFSSFAFPKLLNWELVTALSLANTLNQLTPEFPHLVRDIIHSTAH